jgi:hypothetical protein
MIDIITVELDWDVVQTKAGFRYIMSIAILIFIISVVLQSTYFTNEVSAQSADVPNWRTGTIWQYNITIADQTGNHKATIKNAGWGEYTDPNGTVFNTWNIFYTLNTAHSNESFGTLNIRDSDQRSVTRYDYKTGFSTRKVTYNYTYGEENITVWYITNYYPLINTFNFPLQVGDQWHNEIYYNTTIEVKSASDELISQDIEKGTFMEYNICTIVTDILLNETDNQEILLGYNIEVNWTKEVVKALKILQDDEEQDTDGNYKVFYYNFTRGNFVRKEFWENHQLNMTWSLVYTDYFFSPEAEEYEESGEDNPEVFLCISGIVILAILAITFVIIRKRSIPKGDRFTKEYIEAVDTKTELVELCEEAKLSTKGAKSQLRKRLIAYVGELEVEECDKKQGEEDFEDEVLPEDEVDMEEDIDELTPDEEDEGEKQGGSESNDK